MSFEQSIIMQPNCLYKDLKSLLKAKLIERVQGSVSEKYGYVVCVLNVDDSESGKVMDTTGDVLFNIKYKAVVMKPFEGEVLDGVIERVDKFGAQISVGPFKVFISNSQFPSDFEYNETSNSYISRSQNDKLAVDTEVRFRIIGVQFESNEFHPTGSMNEHYLGPLH